MSINENTKKNKRVKIQVIAIAILILLSVVGIITGGIKLYQANKETVSISKSEVVIIENEEGTVTSDIEAYDYIVNNASKLGIENIDNIKFDDSNSVLNNNYYDFLQTYQGIPVYGRKITVMTDENGGVLLTSGNYSEVSSEISTIATISNEDIRLNIENYIADTLKIENAENVEISGISEKNLIIYNLDNDEEHLAYSLNVSFSDDESVENFEFIVDANNGEILLSSNNIVQENLLTEASDDKGNKVSINTWKETDKNYLMYDETRNILVLNANKKEMDFNWEIYLESSTLASLSNDEVLTGFKIPRPKKVESKNNKNWNGKAVSLMKRIEENYDWYADSKNIGLKGWDNKNGKIVAIYDDKFQNGNNAYSSTGYTATKTSHFTLLVFGANKDYSNKDLFAHEYAHSVQEAIHHMAYQGETGAIKEGFADIMGEIVEEDKNWYHSSGRNIANPTDTKDPSKVNDDYYKDTSDVSKKNDYGGVHQNSTVISHMTYLMSNGIDGNDRKKINNVQIARLWYQTLMLCTENTNFSELRGYMCALGKTMLKKHILSNEQYMCIEEAFDTVGITNGTIGISTNETINIQDIYGRPLDNATVKIYSVNIKEKQHLRTNSGTVSNKALSELNTDEKGNITTNLSEGTYKFVIVDNSDPKSAVFEKFVWCFGDVKRKYANIVTNFREGIVSDFTFTETEKTIAIDEKDVIGTYIYPEGATDYEIVWNSSNENVATINEDGIIKAKSNGESLISATLTSGGKSFSAEATVTVTEKQRDIVMVLDCSGSMYGEALDEMKKSAIRFCEDILSNNPNDLIKIITYDSYVNSTEFTNDMDLLESYIDNLDTGGTTNMYAALSEAEYQLSVSARENSVKNIFVMADGLPNEGHSLYNGIMTDFCNYKGIHISSDEYGNAVCEIAATIMENYNMYSLGFFHSLSGDNYEYCDALMSNLQNSGYYVVDKAENLQISFGNVSTNISDGSKIVITIACPVDVVVEYNGESLASDSGSNNKKTSFGSLDIVGTNNDIKVLTLEADKNYDISLNGTGYGTMDYSIMYYDENDDVSDERTFENVPITANTFINTNTDKTVNTKLSIDSDGDGAEDTIWVAGENESGIQTYGEENKETKEQVNKETNNKQNEKKNIKLLWIVVIVVCSVALFTLIIILIVLLVKNSRNKQFDRSETYEEAESEHKKDYKERIKNVHEGRIVLNSGIYKGNVVSVAPGEEIYIGKDSSRVSIVVPNEYKAVSRVHCLLKYDMEKEAFFITDYSSNGTYVNKKRMPKNVAMRLDKYSLVELSKDGFGFIVND